MKPGNQPAERGMEHQVSTGGTSEHIFWCFVTCRSRKVEAGTDDGREIRVVGADDTEHPSLEVAPTLWVVIAEGFSWLYDLCERALYAHVSCLHKG